MGKVRIAPTENEPEKVELGRSKSARFKDDPVEEVRVHSGTNAKHPTSHDGAKKEADSKKRGKDKPVPGAPEAAGRPGFLTRLKSLYYTKSGAPKEFVSFTAVDVPMFLSVEGDRPTEVAPTGNEHEYMERQPELALLQKKTRKVVVAPSILEYKTYRDLIWLSFLISVVGFMIGVGLRTYNMTNPPEFQCHKYPCEGAVRSDGTQVTYYVINEARNKDNDLPYECLAQYNSTLRIWTSANFQIKNDTFDPVLDCATKRAIYYTLILGSTTPGETQGEVEPWSLLMVAATPVAVNLIVTVLALILKSQTYRLVFGLTIAGGAAGVAFAAYYGSLWAIAWGVIMAVAAATLFFTRFRHEKLEMPLGRACRTLLKFPQLMVFATLVTVMQCIWFVGWLWCFLKLSSRMGTAADVFLFFSLLWIFQYFNKLLYAVSGSVFAAWYYTLTEPRGKKRPIVRWPLVNGFKRCTLHSSGTICAWATLDALIKSITVAQNSLRMVISPRSQVFAVLLGIVKSIFRSVNPYGLCYAMIYGKGLLVSSAEAYGLIDETNINLLTADSLLNYAGMASGGLAGMACVLTAWLVTHFYLPPPPNNDKDMYTVSLYLPAFFLGAIVGAPVMTVLEGMVAMLYINFADRPENLQARDNDLYVELADLWIVARDEHELEMMDDDEFEQEEEYGNLRDNPDTDSDGDDVEKALGLSKGKKKKSKGRGQTMDTGKATVIAQHVVTLKLT